MGTRFISGAILTLIFAAMLILHGWVIVGFFMAIALCIEYEMIKTVRMSGVKPIQPVLYLYTALLMPTYYFFGLAAVLVLQMFAAMFIFVCGIILQRYDFESIFTSIFCLYYPQMFFVFLYMILLQPDASLSTLMVLVAFVCAAMTDIFAYFIGRFWGKHPLCPAISPKKTMEGSVGGLVGGIIGVEVIALIFDQGRIYLIEYAVFAFLLSIFSQIGDLAASVVKRKYGAKDFGSIIPGHGGFLDRLDSTLFIMPMVYMFYKIYLHL